jgi:hypothetical protein
MQQAFLEKSLVLQLAQPLSRQLDNLTEWQLSESLNPNQTTRNRPDLPIRGLDE